MLGYKGYKTSRPQDDNLLEQVLRQGEALRSAMLQTIVKNQPLSAPNSTITKTSSTNHELQNVEISLPEKHACLAYMNGDPMSKDEEQQALNTFRSLSGSDICDLTSRSFTTVQHSCKCDTCQAYCKLNDNFIPPLNLKHCSTSGAARKTKTSERVTFTSKSSRKHDNFEVFQYADSLKVILYSFILTNEGKTKLCDILSEKNQFSNVKNRLKFEDLNVTYFIEYEIPLGISKGVGKKQSRVDSGLNSVSFVKKCSKNIIKNVVYFKQITIHNIENLDIVELEDIEIVLKITARALRQKKSVVLGEAKFNFTEFYESPTLSCLQEIPVFLTPESPISSGSIRIQLQLGCDRLYFGKDFIDSLQNKENRLNVNVESKENLDETFTLNNEEKSTKTKLASNISSSLCKKAKEKLTKVKILSKDTKKPIKEAQNKESEKISEGTPQNDSQISNEKIILFGFIFISNVEYQYPYKQTYFTCQPFCQHDYICSNVTLSNVNTNFNYHQVIPYVYDEDFLFNLRENHMIIEFFASHSTTYSGDEVIGICKVPLHQYYLAFRNPVIVKYLTRNNLPVIGTDWYEPIKDVASGDIVGNAQILVALGSEEQVKNLQKERGFMDDSVKRNKSSFNIQKSPQKPILRSLSNKVFKKQQNKKLQTAIEGDSDVDLTTRTQSGKVDKSTSVTPTLHQSTSQNVNCPMMDPNKSTSNIVDDRLQTIQDYLQQLVELKTSSQTQNITSTTNEQTGSESLEGNNINSGETTKGQSRSTSGLLETLQDVMNVEYRGKQSFKAQIIVESALHLPARKKCRARKVKGKIVREEMQPTTYVSYEIKDGVVKTSHVVHKCTSPEWFMKNNVLIPVDYLTNSNRRLLFKVWRKSNSGSMIPNMQNDTIIGFATVDLTVLLAGLPTIEGWFNIMDFSNKCNGQIKINVIPLEDISNFNHLPSTTNSSYTNTPTSTTTTTNATTPSAEAPNPSSLTTSPDETFSRALKRKFIELEEISQRLKARLNHVTEDLPPESENDDTNDESADEFEKDINTLCVEEDYDLLDFAKEAQDMNLRRVSTSLHQWQQGSSTITQELMITTDNDNNSSAVPATNTENKSDAELALQVAPNLTSMDNEEKDESEKMKPFIPEGQLVNDSEDATVSSSSSSCTLDRQLSEGKERIDHLLQRLTSLSMAQQHPVDLEGIPGFGSRHASGCSTNQDLGTGRATAAAAGIVGNTNLEEDILSELGIQSDFDVRKLLNQSVESFNGNLEALLGRCYRDAPDGEGNSTESSSGDDKLN